MEEQNIISEITDSQKLIKVYECLSGVPVSGSVNIKKMAGVFSILEEVINSLRKNEGEAK